LPDDPTLERPDDPNDTAKLKAVLLLVAAVAFAVVPFFTDPFTGFGPDRFPVPVDDPPIQPAGWAFAIWGVIYLWLLASAGFGLFKRDIDPGWDATRWPLIVSLAIGASWIPVALTAPVMSTILIWVMLIGALLALRAAPAHDRAWLALPIGLYAGWLTAASCVALATVAAGYGLGSVSTAQLGWRRHRASAGDHLHPERSACRPIRWPSAWALAGIVAANATDGPAFAGAALGGVLGMLWLTLKILRPRV
jgi:hypothetical protein